MSYHTNDDGSVTFSDVPDEAERKRASATARRKMERERGSKVEDKDDDKDHKSHPRTTAAKGTAVPRETGTKVVEETDLPPMPD